MCINNYKFSFQVCSVPTPHLLCIIIVYSTDTNYNKVVDTSPQSCRLGCFKLQPLSLLKICSQITTKSTLNDLLLRVTEARPRGVFCNKYYITIKRLGLTSLTVSWFSKRTKHTVHYDLRSHDGYPDRCKHWVHGNKWSGGLQAVNLLLAAGLLYVNPHSTSPCKALWPWNYRAVLYASVHTRFVASSQVRQMLLSLPYTDQTDQLYYSEHTATIRSTPFSVPCFSLSWA